MVWNVVEGVVAVWAGLLADSVALLSFGIDSFIETTSAAIVLWRLRTELGGRSPERNEARERLAARAAGGLLFALAVFIAFEAGRRLLGYGAEAEPSFVGIALTAVSLVVMPLLGWAKLRTAGGLGSAALRADAYETITCAWLSFGTLVGLVLNATLGWAWADPLAALLILPLIVREGWEAWSGEECHHCENDGK